MVIDKSGEGRREGSGKEGGKEVERRGGREGGRRGGRGGEERESSSTILLAICHLSFEDTVLRNRYKYLLSL